jgi:cytochrome c oxidase subunit 2
LNPRRNTKNRKISLPFGSKWGCQLAWLSLLLGGCAEVASPSQASDFGTPSVLNPRGLGAAEIANLWWLLLGLATLVFVAVMGLLLYALFRPRHQQAEIEPSPNRDRLLVIVGGIIVPLIILFVIFGFTLRTMAALAATNPSDQVVVEIVGHQWWWEVNYPLQEVTTANEIHIPAGSPIELKVTSVDVIHSFWVPELHGKIDLIPNQTNSFWLQADEPGVYYGECAEFCGIQHAKMALVVVAQPEAEFTTWLEQQQQPATQITDATLLEGQQIFLGSACLNCHTVKGTNATGDLGPDLTHLASRLTLAAGTIENNRTNLAGWIIDPQNIKPGNLMPSTDLTETELQTLLAYLESLK